MNYKEYFDTNLELRFKQIKIDEEIREHLLKAVNALGPGCAHESIVGFYEWENHLVVDAQISWLGNDFTARYEIPLDEI